MSIQLPANDSGRCEGGLQRAADVPVLMRVRRNFWVGLGYGVDLRACDLLAVDLRSSIGSPFGSMGSAMPYRG